MCFSLLCKICIPKWRKTRPEVARTAELVKKLENLTPKSSTEELEDAGRQLSRSSFCSSGLGSVEENSERERKAVEIQRPERVIADKNVQIAQLAARA
jgi:hypothetical protein